MSLACPVGGMLGLLVADAVLTDGGVGYSFLLFLFDSETAGTMMVKISLSFSESGRLY